MTGFRVNMLWLLFLLACLGAMVAYLEVEARPPKESTVIANFYTHRATYERLLTMLREDKELFRVTTDDLETLGPDGHFPSSRYNEYRTLLKDAGDIAAYRSRGKSSESFGMVMWTGGGAPDLRHINICWLEDKPANQIANLDDFYRSPKPRSPVFRHIEDHWYIWADW